MKFSFNAVNGSRARSGTLTGFSRFPDIVFETPLLLFYTKGGSIPHLTHEVLQLLTTEQQTVQITLPTTYHSHEAVKQFKKGISSFVGLQECLTCLSVQDPAYKTPVGYNKQRNVSIWTNQGRVSLNSSEYMDIVEAFKPDFYEALSNGDTNIDTAKKKIGKVVESSKQLFDGCLQRHCSSELVNTSGILAAVEGGYNSEARKKSAASYKNAPVDGFVINGLHNNGPDVEEIDFKSIEDVIDVTVDNLPSDKLRLLHGSWTPSNLLKLVDSGIDAFDSSYPYLVTERKGALVFRFEIVDRSQTTEESESPMLEINLSDSKFKEDFVPLVDGCACLSCTKHTRAYIHHLINNRELLASTLLMIHNLHHYIEFFKTIRSALASDKRVILRPR
ncbi:Queuine tRNA-ribosyltransferase catalytic subunit 1 [Nesidiocoris tenuis]|uniref:Queuine tRNA-ribosyltransferase accessory subunit 2 n=1 Tax=Nesidiocoris tenuis TaxID=355587 RepID=A0ABN7BGY9_9HEMI|nr:Queuine tRNA-ribosyltransferase catalytic subunit 1 [Nesidiocoris tenuis]